MNVSNEVDLNPPTASPTSSTSKTASTATSPTITKTPTKITTTTTTRSTIKAKTTNKITGPSTNTHTTPQPEIPSFKDTIFVERYLTGDHIFAKNPCYQFKNTHFTFDMHGGVCSCVKEHPIFHYISKVDGRIEFGCYAVSEICKGIKQ